MQKFCGNKDILPLLFFIFLPVSLLTTHVTHRQRPLRSIAILSPDLSLGANKSKLTGFGFKINF